MPMRIMMPNRSSMVTGIYLHNLDLGIYLHVGPVVAVADVGAMALVEACAPHRVHAARIYGYRGSPIGAG